MYPNVKGGILWISPNQVKNRFLNANSYPVAIKQIRTDVRIMVGTEKQRIIQANYREAS